MRPMLPKQPATVAIITSSGVAPISAPPAALGWSMMMWWLPHWMSMVMPACIWPLALMVLSAMRELPLAMKEASGPRKRHRCRDIPLGVSRKPACYGFWHRFETGEAVQMKKPGRLPGLFRMVRERRGSVLDRPHRGGVETAVDIEDLAADAGSQVRAQEGGGVADFLDGDVAAQGGLLLVGGQHLAEALDAGGGQGADGAGGYGVDAGA